MKNKFALIALVVLFSSLNAYSVEETIIEETDPSWISKTDPAFFFNVIGSNNPAVERWRNFNPFAGYKSILLLADSFTMKSDGPDYAISEAIRTKVDHDAKIHKTSIDIPSARNGKTFGKITYKKVDNRNSMPYDDNQFDLIVMRKGLCVCDPGSKSCGGLDLDSENVLSRFFTEVVRVLNKEKPNSSAILQGAFKYGSGGYSTWEQDKAREALLRMVLSKLEKLNPYLHFEMIYSSMQVGLLVEKYGVPFKKIRDDGGAFLSELYPNYPTSDEALYHWVHHFDGIRITVKASQ